MRRICPGCRTTYDENVVTCPRDGLPLLELSRTFARLPAATAENETPTAESDAESPIDPEVDPDAVLEVDLSEDSTVAVGPGMMVGEYMIERTIAEGGMGAIYAGIHPVISKRVAIKVINKRYAADPKAVARFVLEARSVNQIGHHNIVDIFSIGELDDRRNYLVMELLDGLSLSHILLRAKRLKPGQVLPVYEQLCDALDAAHRKGFIHRDLKPDNVVVLRRPPRPFIKILDFGLAKLRGAAVSHNTEVGTVLGTPEYMAPEQCRGAAVDARTDIYALGVMLYELLTGTKPFTDPSPLRILSMHQHKPALAPSRLSAMSPRLEQVILRAMAKKPEDRFPSVKELLAELRVAIPMALAWPEDLVAWEVRGDAHRRTPATVPPGDALRQDLMAAMTPISISGEMAPLSGEIEDEDNLQTLVSEPKQRPARPPLPDQAIGEVPSGETESSATTEVDDNPIQAIPSPPPEEPSDVRQPSPALAAASSAEVADVAESTLVDDQGPIVLVDRPIREARTEEAQEFGDGPTGTMPPKPGANGNGSSKSNGALALELDTSPLPDGREREPGAPPARAREESRPGSDTGRRNALDAAKTETDRRKALDAAKTDTGRRNALDAAKTEAAAPFPVHEPRAARRLAAAERAKAGSARKVPERGFPVVGLIVAILAAALLAIGTVLVIRLLR